MKSRPRPTLRPGEIVFAVYDRESNNEPNRLVAASVGLAIPADSSMHGYLSEHHSFGETDEKAGDYWPSVRLVHFTLRQK